MQPSAPAPTRWSILLAVGGVVLLIMSLCIGCVSLGIITDPPPSTDPDATGVQSWYFCLLCFGFPLLIAAFAFLFFAYRRNKEEQTLALQRMVFDLAHQQGGSLTPQDLALSSNLSLDAAQSLLEEWAVRGICRMEVDESGFTRFWFSQPSSGSAT